MAEESKKPSAENFPKTYVVTSAQGIQNPHSSEHYGADDQKGKLHKPLLKNIERYAKENSAELQICAIPGAYVNEIELDPNINKRKDVYMEKNALGRLERQREKERAKRSAWKENEKEGEMPMHYFWEKISKKIYQITGKKLNSNARIIGMPEPSQNKDPLQGKNVFTKEQGGCSIIIPATKQMLRPVATGQHKFPRLMISTGCCTYPNYNTTNRTGFLADEAHEYGFAVIDIIDDKLYLPRIVPALKNGTFIDLGMKYVPGENPVRAETTALILGDSHTSEIKPETDKANDEMISHFKPKNIHLHDVFNARSINLHELEDEIVRSERSKDGINSLEEELILTRDYIIKKAQLAKENNPEGKVLINYSNHDDMLYRWLARGYYRKDDKNRKLGHKILGEFNLGKKDLALEIAFKYLGLNLDNVKFLKLGEDAIYWGYQCGAHGHKGKNGARGSLKSLTEGYGKVIMGHVHQLEVNQGSISVGTSSKIPLDYQLGQPSTAMAGNAVIYEGGLAQAIPIIEGRWKK